MAIIKSNILPEAIQKALEKAGLENITIGSIWVEINSHYFYVRRVVGFEKTKRYSHAKKEEVYVVYQEARDWEATVWRDESRKLLEEWKKTDHVKLDKPFSEYREESLKVINGEMAISEFEDKESDTVSSETSLVSKNSKETLTALQGNLEDKKKRVEIVRTFVGYEMEKRKRDLEAIKDKLRGVLEVFEKKIKKIMRVITTIELYLGVDEQLFQLQEGQPAKAEVPISFRQMVLFMDEETAEDEKLSKIESGGLDINNIDLFDQWLLKNSNYKKLIPEEKGVIAFKPRRNDKDYKTDDHRYANEMNRANKYTSYFLIRNGDNLYRIFTDKILIWERLFPKRKELQQLFNETSKIIEESNWDSHKEEAKDKLEDAFYYYKKQVVFLQGLIDRSTVFHPLALPSLSVFKMDDEANAKCFNFIYDDEASLPSGRLPFWQWVKKENKAVGHGSRICVVTSLMEVGWKDSDRNYMMNERCFKYYSNDYRTPALPKTGLYELENYKHFEFVTQRKLRDQYKKEEKERCKDLEKKGYELVKEETYKYIWKKFTKEYLTIKYNPGGEVYAGWGTEARERKNGIKFKINQDDRFILNYDQMSLEDIEFYLGNRTDREGYLKMIPLLRTLKKWRLAELEQEKDFAKMVVGQILVQHKKHSEAEVENKVWELIEWWKFKNKIKRPIDKDDSKALRMIIKKYNKQ